MKPQNIQNIIYGVTFVVFFAATLRHNTEKEMQKGVDEMAIQLLSKTRRDVALAARENEGYSNFDQRVFDIIASYEKTFEKTVEPSSYFDIGGILGGILGGTASAGLKVVYEDAARQLSQNSSAEACAVVFCRNNLANVSATVVCGKKPKGSHWSPS